MHILDTSTYWPKNNNPRLTATRYRAFLTLKAIGVVLCCVVLCCVVLCCVVLCCVVLCCVVLCMV